MSCSCRAETRKKLKYFVCTRNTDWNLKTFDVFLLQLVAKHFEKSVEFGKFTAISRVNEYFTNILKLND